MPIVLAGKGVFFCFGSKIVSRTAISPGFFLWIYSESVDWMLCAALNRR
ncbi:hypothetical protein Ga0074812_10529 [Parafrankia irregularis]|uniref:Uncharacterized protein n=1 Tax=Parafrankia irregularis TaxID=795642 RepID=A0A0S4QJ79_9ACTN|nr:hypothetical protein Ga0074812_10529 [Parafrankia irregularis]